MNFTLYTRIRNITIILIIINTLTTINNNSIMCIFTFQFFLLSSTFKKHLSRPWSMHIYVFNIQVLKRTFKMHNINKQFFFFKLSIAVFIGLVKTTNFLLKLEAKFSKEAKRYSRFFDSEKFLMTIVFELTKNKVSYPLLQLSVCTSN